MAMAYSGVAVFVSLVALFMAMIALRVSTDAKIQNAAKTARKTENSGICCKTDADRTQEAVARRELENFMNYDGTEQPPIDPDRILGE